MHSFTRRPSVMMRVRTCIDVPPASRSVLKPRNDTAVGSSGATGRGFRIAGAVLIRLNVVPRPKKGRSVVRMEKTAQLLAFEAKMQTAQAQQIYKERAGVAEFPNAWIKEKMGLRQFRLRGRIKVRMEILWACLAYNICQWIRLRCRPQRLAQA